MTKQFSIFIKVLSFTILLIGSLQPISNDTWQCCNVQLLVDEQKELMRDHLFSSTNIAAMT